MDKEGHILPVGEVWKSDVIDITDNDADINADNKDVTKNVADIVTDNVTDNVTDVTENVADTSTAEKRREEMLRLMKLDKKITYDNLANILHVSRMTVARDIELLRSQNRLMREGEDHGGSWVVL